MATGQNIEAMLGEAWAKRRVGDYSKARQLVEQAQDLCRVDDHNSMGRIYHIYMQFESDHENYPKALEFCRESLKHYQKGGNPNRIAHSTRHVADLLRTLGNTEDAEITYRDAIETYRRETGTFSGDLANALRGYSLALEQLKKYREAIDAWKEVRDLYETCQLEEGVAEADQRLDLLQSNLI